MIFSGVTILQGVEFPIFPIDFAWALQQCSATALPVIPVNVLFRNVLWMRSPNYCTAEWKWMPVVLYSEYKSFEHYFQMSVVFSFVSTRRIQRPSGAEQVLRVFVLIASRLMSAHHMMARDLHAGNASLPKAVIAPARSAVCTHTIGVARILSGVHY